jgi:hypothetical protein
MQFAALKAVGKLEKWQVEMKRERFLASEQERTGKKQTHKEEKVEKRKEKTNNTIKLLTWLHPNEAVE